jgi:anti-sigma-K factor RskA
MAVLRIDDHEAGVVRHFLLGGLTPEETEQFETRLIAEAGLFETVRAVESELLDAFVRGALTAEDRQALAARFEQQPERVRFARALTRRAQRRTVWRRPILWASAAAASLVLVVGAGLLRKSVLSDPVQTAPATASREVRTAPAPPAASPEAGIAAFTIALATTRDAERPPRLELAPDVSAVALSVRLHPADRYPVYELSLSRADGSPVWSGRVTTRSADGITATIPASALDPGTYELLVAGFDAGGHREELGAQTLIVAAHSKSP